MGKAIKKLVQRIEELEKERKELEACRVLGQRGYEAMKERAEKAEADATIECWMCYGKGGQAFDGLFRNCEWCDGKGRMTRKEERKRLLVERETRESVHVSQVKEEAQEKIGTAANLAESHRVVRVEAETQRDAALDVCRKYAGHKAWCEQGELPGAECTCGWNRAKAKVLGDG